jgi:hypothetical protein
MQSVILLSVILVRVPVLSSNMPSANLLSFTMMSVIVMNVVAPCNGDKFLWRGIGGYTLTVNKTDNVCRENYYFLLRINYNVKMFYSISPRRFVQLQLR